MFSTINNLLPPTFRGRNKYEINDHKIKYGQNANLSFKVDDDSGNYTGSRPGAFIGNQVTLLGNFRSTVGVELPIYDGYRADVIDTEGAFNFELAQHSISKTSLMRQEQGSALRYLEYTDGYKNAVGLMYNLLRLYYIHQNANVKYDPNDDYYNNGHVKIKNYQIFKGYTVRRAMKDSVIFEPSHLADMHVNLRQDDIPELPSIKWTGFVSSKSASVIKDAIGRWECIAPFGIAHSSEALCEELVINSTGSVENVDDVSYTSADVKFVINKIVADNYLYTDFMFAYMMFMQVYVSPIPRSAEAAAWFLDAQNVKIPELRIDSGYFPYLYSGNLYSRSADWKETFMNWRQSPGAMLFHSILLVEAAFVELGNVVRVQDGDEIDRTNYVEVAVDGNPVSNSGVLNDFVLLSMRYGKEFYFPYAISSGLTRSDLNNYEVSVDLNVIITDVDAPKYYNLVNADVKTGMESVLLVTQLTPPLYPVMSYGINTDAYYANSLEIDVEFDVDIEDGLISYTDKEDFSKFMNCMRLSGYDVTAKEVFTNKFVTNWADNASGRFLYTDAQVGNKVYFLIDVSKIVRRKNSWMNILTFKGRTKFSVRMNAVNFKMYNGSKEMLFYGRKISALKANHYVSKLDEIASQTDAVKIMPLQKISVKDFRFIKYQFPGLSGAVNTVLSRHVMLQSGEEDQEPVNPIPATETEID